MYSELFADGMAEITVTGSIVRMDFISLSATEKDEKNNPTPTVRQRVIMQVDAFANAVDLMQRALAGLVEAGAIRRVPDVQRLSVAPAATGRADSPQRSAISVNASPNFT